MLREHIIEPNFLIEIAKTRRNCVDFKNEFTKPSPRVVGFYPKLKNFKRLVLTGQNVDVSDIEKARLLELLNIIKSCGFQRIDQFDGQQSFTENLINLDIAPITHTCLLKNINEPITIKAKILTIEDFERGVERITSQVLVPKSSIKIAETLTEIVRLSSNITIVDPYFSTQKGVWDTFLLILEKSILHSPVSVKHITVMFDGSKKTAMSCRFLADSLRNLNLPFLDINTRIDFKDMRENGNEAIHNRYVITELAGVSLPYGLQATNEQEQDEFSLLNENIYSTRYQQYVECKAVDIFECASLRQ